MGLGAAGTAAVVAGGVGAAGAVGSSLIGSKGAKDAANAQAQAANNAAAVQQAMFETSRSDLAPYRDFGTDSMARVRSIFGIGGAQPVAPSATPLAPSGVVPAQVTGGQNLLQMGFNPSNPGAMLPAGYRIINQDAGDAGGSARSFLTDATGNILTMLPGPENSTGQVTQALSYLQGQGVAPTPQAAAAPTPAQPLTAPSGQNAVAGALPGPQSAVNPYAIPTDEATLEQTPGYKFILNQGMRAVMSSNAAKGLGLSGQALRDAASYTTGLADTTYQNQFNNSLAANQQYYNSNIAPLLGFVGLGQNSAAMSASNALTAGNGIANTLTSAGNARAAGAVGSANALSGGLMGAANSATGAYYMNKLLGASSGEPQIGGTSDVGTGNASEVLSNLRSNFA